MGCSPQPIFLVLRGLGIGLIPGVPNVQLHPDLVLLIFLPPLLYSASFFTGAAGDPVRGLQRDPRQARDPGAHAPPAHPAARGRARGHRPLEQEARARLHAAEAALGRIDDLEREDWTLGDPIDRLRGIYHYRRDRFDARFDEEADDGAIEDRSSAWRRMMFAVIDAQRDAIEGMRRSGEISDEVMRSVERDLDLEERRLEEARR
jgi:hypothetical protein